MVYSLEVKNTAIPQAEIKEKGGIGNCQFLVTIRVLCMTSSCLFISTKVLFYSHHVLTASSGQLSLSPGFQELQTKRVNMIFLPNPPREMNFHDSFQCDTFSSVADGTWYKLQSFRASMKVRLV